MAVWVVYASEYGSTNEIAESIAAELSEAGHATELRDAADVGDLAGADALVVGSAVYAGHWLNPVRELIAGKLDRDALSRPERLMVRALRVPEGDFGDWDAIRSWARGIAAELDRA